MGKDGPGARCLLLCLVFPAGPATGDPSDADQSTVQIDPAAGALHRRSLREARERIRGGGRRARPTHFLGPPAVTVAMYLPFALRDTPT